MRTLLFCYTASYLDLQISDINHGLIELLTFYFSGFCSQVMHEPSEIGGPYHPQPRRCISRGSRCTLGTLSPIARAPQEAETAIKWNTKINPHGIGVILYFQTTSQKQKLSVLFSSEPSPLFFSLPQQDEFRHSPEWFRFLLGNCFGNSEKLCIYLI